MRSPKRLIAIAALASTLGLVAAGCGGSSKKAADTSTTGTMTLQIGFSGDFSGPVAPYDVPLRNGMEMAAKQINAAGGPVKVKISTLDNKNQQTLDIQNAQQLVQSGYKIQALTTVEGMIAVGQLVARNGGIAAGGMATTPSIIHSVGPNAFSLIFSDMAQAATAAKYACGQHYHSAYLVVAPEYDYTKYLPAYFQDAFKHLCNGTVVGETDYKLGQTDFSAQVTKIQNNSPQADVIYSGLFLPDTGVFLKQLRASGVKTPYIGGDGNDSKFFMDSAGSAANGVVYTAHVGCPTPGSSLATFYKQYQQLMGKQVESFAFEAVGRDHVYALVAAAKSAHSVQPKAVEKAVLAMKNFQGVTGTITKFDQATRFPIKQVHLIKITGGKRTCLAPVVPSYIPKPQYK